MIEQFEGFYKQVVDVILQNIKGRNLVLRFKDLEFENYLFTETGIKASFYITRNRARVNNRDTFADEIIKGGAQNYYLVVTKELKWNQYDYDRYKNMGYEDYKDILWLRPKPKRIATDFDTNYSDEKCNTILTQSKAMIDLNGIGSSVKIGQNIVMPSFPITIGNGISLVIEDNCSIKPRGLLLAEGSSLIIHDRVNISGMYIFVNSYSTVEIGQNTTIQTGNLRTGRNQEIIIGEDCMFSWDITLLGHDGHLIWDIESGSCINNTAGARRQSITISDHVWLGGETVVMPNSSIGSGSICGYRSMVRGTIPNNCIAVGSPARVVKRNIAWSRENISNDEMDFYRIKEDYRTHSIEM